MIFLENSPARSSNGKAQLLGRHGADNWADVSITFAYTITWCYIMYSFYSKFCIMNNESNQFSLQNISASPVNFWSLSIAEFNASYWMPE